MFGCQMAGPVIIVPLHVPTLQDCKISNLAKILKLDLSDALLI